jgi:hypothetical protein
MGGAYIHNIGIPKPGKPHFNPDTAGQPVRFEDCDFTRGRITDCNLSHVEIDRCEMQGLKINGIPVEDLLQAYDQWKK